MQYMTMEEVVDRLGITYNAISYGFWAIRKNKIKKESIYHILQKNIIKKNGSKKLLFPAKIILDLEKMEWQKEDTICRVVNMMSDVIADKTMTLNELAEMLNVPYFTLKKYLSYVRNPNYETALRLEKILLNKFKNKFKDYYV